MDKTTIEFNGNELKESVTDYMPKELIQGVCQMIAQGLKDGSLKMNPPPSFVAKKI